MRVTATLSLIVSTDAGDELTRENVIAALQSIEGYDSGLYHNLDFTQGFQGNNSVLLLQVTPQGLRPVSDWLEYQETAD